MDFRGSINFSQINNQKNPDTPSVTEAIKEGKKEAIKEEIKKKDQSDKNLDKLLNKLNNNVLLKISSIWPFDLFPKDIIIDTNKVNIIYRVFFFSERRRSILIKDITDIFVDTDLLFASMKFVDRSYAENVLEIKFLPKADALRARRIIQGLVVAVQNGVDLNEIPSQEIVEKIEELGKTNVDS